MRNIETFPRFEAELRSRSIGFVSQVKYNNNQGRVVQHTPEKTHHMSTQGQHRASGGKKLRNVPVTLCHFTYHLQRPVKITDSLHNKDQG